MTHPQGGMMFGAKSSSNTMLLHHTLYLPFREEAQVRPGSPPNSYLPSHEEEKAIPFSPLLNNVTYL